MNRLILSLIIFFTPLISYSQGDRTEPLNFLIEKISKADDLYVEFQVNSVKGKISISKDAVYISQSDKIEIFESDGNRYIFNVKRRRVDIETITPADDNVRRYLDWSNNIEQYKISVKGRGSDRKSSYTLTKDDEVVEVDLAASGELLRFTYKNKETEKISFNIKELKINERKTVDFFKFNPQVREDLVVTDYRF